MKTIFNDILRYFAPPPFKTMTNRFYAKFYAILMYYTSKSDVNWVIYKPFKLGKCRYLYILFFVLELENLRRKFLWSRTKNTPQTAKQIGWKSWTPVRKREFSGKIQFFAWFPAYGGKIWKIRLKWSFLKIQCTDIAWGILVKRPIFWLKVAFNTFEPFSRYIES